MKLSARESALLSARERALLQSARQMSVADLAKRIRHVRELRDKQRQLEQRQRIASGARTGSKSGLSGKANARTGQKERIFVRALEHFENQLATLDRESRAAVVELKVRGRKPATKAARKKAATSSRKATRAPGKAVAKAKAKPTTKATAKRAAKPAAKTPAKRTAKPAAKPTPRRAAKPAAKAAPRRAVKPATKAITDASSPRREKVAPATPASRPSGLSPDSAAGPQNAPDSTPAINMHAELASTKGPQVAISNKARIPIPNDQRGAPRSVVQSLPIRHMPGKRGR